MNSAALSAYLLCANISLPRNDVPPRYFRTQRLLNAHLPGTLHLLLPYVPACGLPYLLHRSRLPGTHATGECAGRNMVHVTGERSSRGPTYSRQPLVVISCNTAMRCRTVRLTPHTATCRLLRRAWQHDLRLCRLQPLPPRDHHTIPVATFVPSPT